LGALNAPFKGGLKRKNHSGLLRQFFPKQMALNDVSEKEVFVATDLMNSRQRKCLAGIRPV